MEQNKYDEIVLGRYSRFIKKSLASYYEENGVSEETIEPILQRLEYYVENPLHFSRNILPEIIIKNRQKVLPKAYEMIENIRNSYDSDNLKDLLNELFIEHIWLVRYTTGMWLLPNPGVAIELTKVRSNMQNDFLDWLEKEYNVHVGDKVIHRHVIQNKRRGLLSDLGIDVPHTHWDKSYYVDTMVRIQEIHRNNTAFVGVISDGSWTYSPKMYDLAPDGKPYAAFTFLSDDRLVGDRLFMKRATNSNDQANQLEFASENERRGKYIEEGILNVDVYYAFYPRERLLRTDFVEIMSERS